MTGKISRLGPTTTMTPRQAIEHALSREAEDGMKEVMICGYYEDGEFFTWSSRMTRRDGLWLAELLKEWVVHGGDDE